MNYFILAAFMACIPLANWLIGNVGAVCVPDGPCLVPVWPGIMAPSGVLVIGAALVLRDAVQQQLGTRWAIGAIVAGALLAGLVAPPALVVASAAAFLLSELADLAVYTPLRRRGLAWAVLLSGLAGAVIDSALFLWLAFGSLDYMAGQVIGKLYASVVVAAFFALRARRALA